MIFPNEQRQPYRSRLRAEQAAATRLLILDAATRLFVERGYTATSIDAIADAAEVARSTVFTAAGGKPWLLKTAYDRALAGDDEPVPIAGRAVMRELRATAHPGAVVSRYADFIAEAAERVSPIYEAIRSAAGSDPEVQQLWDEISEQRLTGAGQFITLLKGKGGLRDGLSVRHARDIVWIHNDPGLHYALVHCRGWKQLRYRDWLARTLSDQVLPSPPC
jgi:AcrR family transcriptional regulator